VSLKISLPTDPKTKFNPGDEVTIGFKSYLLGDKRSELIKFIIPKFPKRIDFVKVNLGTSLADFEVLANTQYGITSYRSVHLAGTQTNRVTFRLSPAPTRLKRNDLMNVTAGVGGLAGINSENYKIASKDQTRPYISVIVPRHLVAVGSGTVDPSANYLTEIIKLAKGKMYTIAIERGYVKTLQYNDYVRDYLIFAYRQSANQLTPSDKKRFVLDNSIVEFEPPPYSSTLDANLKKREKYLFFADNSDGNYIEFFVAVARYIRRGDQWFGDWLHQGPRQAPIWAKAQRPV